MNAIGIFTTVVLLSTIGFVVESQRDGKSGTTETDFMIKPTSDMDARRRSA
jgi:hypothetical protein